MRVYKISAKNYKGFENLELNLDGKDTIIVGVNGTGKSSTLAIISYLCWPWLNRLNPAQGISYRSISSDLVRFGKTNLELSMDVQIGTDNYTFSKLYSKTKNRKNAFTKTSKASYDKFLDNYYARFMEGEGNIPILVNYGTNRSVLDIPLRIRNKHDFSILTSLEHATEHTVAFRTFFEWYRNQEDYENEMKRETGDLNYEDIPLKCVKQAVHAMMVEFTDLKVRRNPLRMTVTKNGVEYRVDQLSDGEKCTLAMFGDLARRIALANPNRANPLTGEGIVLIDEIELHMHPSWQRLVFPTLKKVFPNIQFIISTHSPQILGEVTADANIFKFQTDQTGQLYISSEKTYGKDSNAILRMEMNTTERSETIMKKFELFYNALDDGEYENAENILNELKVLIGEDRELAECQISLDLERM